MGGAESIGRLSGVRHVLDVGDLCPHDAPGLDGDGILDRNGVGQQFHVADAVFDIGALETLIRIGKCGVDFFLYGTRFIDQIHQFADQDIPFPVHQVVALFRQRQRVLRQHQISLGRKCTRIHRIPPSLRIILLPSVYNIYPVSLYPHGRVLLSAVCRAVPIRDSGSLPCCGSH